MPSSVDEMKLKLKARRRKLEPDRPSAEGDATPPVAVLEAGVSKSAALRSSTVPLVSNWEDACRREHSAVFRCSSADRPSCPRRPQNIEAFLPSSEETHEERAPSILEDMPSMMPHLGELEAKLAALRFRLDPGAVVCGDPPRSTPRSVRRACTEGAPVLQRVGGVGREDANGAEPATTLQAAATEALQQPGFLQKSPLRHAQTQPIDDVSPGGSHRASEVSGGARSRRKELAKQLASTAAERDGVLVQKKRLHAEARRLESDNAKLADELVALKAKLLCRARQRTESDIPGGTESNEEVVAEPQAALAAGAKPEALSGEESEGVQVEVSQLSSDKAPQLVSPKAPPEAEQAISRLKSEIAGMQAQMRLVDQERQAEKAEMPVSTSVDRTDASTSTGTLAYLEVSVPVDSTDASTSTGPLACLEVSVPVERTDASTSIGPLACLEVSIPVERTDASTSIGPFAHLEISVPVERTDASTSIGPFAHHEARGGLLVAPGTAKSDGSPRGSNLSIATNRSNWQSCILAPEDTPENALIFAPRPREVVLQDASVQAETEFEGVLHPAEEALTEEARDFYTQRAMVQRLRAEQASTTHAASSNANGSAIGVCNSVHAITPAVNTGAEPAEGLVRTPYDPCEMQAVAQRLQAEERFWTNVLGQKPTDASQLSRAEHT